METTPTTPITPRVAVLMLDLVHTMFLCGLVTEVVMNNRINEVRDLIADDRKVAR